MCDYSLAAFRNRLAVEGEELVVYRFPTGALGLASPADVEAYNRVFRRLRDMFNPRELPCAVCIPPGARLLLRDIPKHVQREFGVGPAEHVEFTQTNTDAYRYRDGVRFENGHEILLQLLIPRQQVQVLSLGSSDGQEEHRRQVPEHRQREEEYRQIFADLV